MAAIDPGALIASAQFKRKGRAAMMSKRAIVLAICLASAAATLYGQAGTADGAAALALAGVVAANSPTLSAHDKRVIAELFDGNKSVTYPAHQKISVKADAIVCRFSNVDITQRSCELTFGSQKRSLKGRAANELNATMIQAGVRSDGAAGTIYESFSALVCTIDPNEAKSGEGGGASCTYAAYQ
jgi:hypothetical protein